MLSSQTLGACLGLALLAAVGEAKDKTRVFADTQNHPAFEFEDITEGSSLAGVVIGIGLLGVFIITTIVIIIGDERRRHRDYKEKRDRVLAECSSKGYDFKSKENQEEYSAWKKAKIL